MNFSNKSFIYQALIFLAIGIISACSTDITGDLEENQAPETFTVVDTIIRTGDDRLNSEVHIRWWGNDPDGFIVGFEYSFNNSNWSFISKNDSVFVLSPPAGMDTMDFTFAVRAIDNLGLKDPSPATLSYPVKNSLPTVAYIPATNNPIKTFPVLKFNFAGSDPDGNDNLNRYEIVLNDTTRTPYTLPATANSFTLIGQNVSADSTVAEVYINNNTTPEQGTIPGLLLNANNTIYIRAIDNSEAKSPFVASYTIYVKKVNSNILLVNAYVPSTTAIEDFYAQQLINLGFTNFDTIQIFEQVGGASTQQSPDNLTQSRIFDLFDGIVWFSNSAQRSLSLAQRTTGMFFNSGGKMLMSVYFSSAFDEQSQFLDFTPIQSLVNPPDTTLIMDNGALLTPAKAGWPVLQSTTIVGVVKPINLISGAEALYAAELKARDNTTFNITPWTGNSNVIALRKSTSGVPNFVISTLELDKLNGNNNIDLFFEKVLKQEFGF